MYFLMTYGKNKKTSNKTRFMHKVTDDPLLDIMTMNQNDYSADYTIINVLKINEDQYLSQSIQTIKNNIEFI